MKHAFIFIFTFLSLTSSGLLTAVASDFYDNDPLSFDVTMTKEEFIEQTTLYENDPFDDELLAYKVRLPKDWKIVSSANLENLNLNSWVLGGIAKFVSPPIKDDRATFTVSALEMKKYMSVDNWFRGVISVQGGFINNIRIFSDNLVHAEYSIFQNGKNYFVRSVVQRGLNRVVLAEYKVPTNYAGEYRDTQKWTMSLFRTGRTDYGYKGLTMVHDYLKFAEHMYPNDWMVKSGKYDSVNEIWYTFGRVKRVKSRVSDKISIVGMDYAKGYIKTLFFSKTKFKNYEEKWKEIIEKEKKYNFETKKVITIERGVGKINNTVAFYPTTVYMPKEEVNDENQEYWIGINETSNHYFIVYMKIPSRYFHYNLWAENVGAFNLVLNTFKPNK